MKCYHTKLLDVSHKLDINLLENFVNCLYHGEAAQGEASFAWMLEPPASASQVLELQQRTAEEVLTQIKEHPDVWMRVDTLLEFSLNMNMAFWKVWLKSKVKDSSKELM